MKPIESLMECGFNLYESKILLALAKLKTAGASEIEKDSNVPKNKVYEILDNFKRKGIVQLLPSKPKKYSLINIEQVLKEIVNEKKKNLDIVDKSLDRLYENLGSNTSYEETFWIMEGVDAMVNKIVDTLKDLKEESIGYIDIWVVKPENVKAVKKAIKHGVKFYFLGTIDKESKPLAKKYAKLGVKIRHYPIKGAGYSIFDKKYVQLRVTTDKLINLWIENENLAGIMRQHFFELWKKGKPVKFN
ncbi:MAG TPA: helix-turn-helix domain-containing protein [Candidatus Nanoarchaeia archaeon]|nr:helix-turn-helix domain-containing protein [Candidatus Nanoarchaeia archaeon]